MLAEWVTNLTCNYKCEYCKYNHNNSIKCTTNEKELCNFIKFLKNSNFELVSLYGGEPFLHPRIKFIIEQLNENHINYEIMSNCSQIKKINSFDNLQKRIIYTIHPNIVTISQSLKIIEAIQDKIKFIQIMFADITDLNFLKEIKKTYNFKIVMKPVIDFDVDKDTYRDSIIKYNKIMSKMSQYAEDSEITTQLEKWYEEPLCGKKCICKNNITFSPDLKKYSCTYLSNDNICKHRICGYFL